MKRLKKNEILVLRSCENGGRSRGGFVWPIEVGATVTAPDWNGTDECGGGLHGLPWGEGVAYCDLSDPVWLVLRVDISEDNYRHGTGDMLDKCKFKSCAIEGAFENPKDATDMILRYAPAGTVCNYCTLTGGYGSTLTGGDDSTLSIKWWDGHRTRISIAYVGEDGIKPNTPYRLDNNGRFVEAK